MESLPALPASWQHGIFVKSTRAASPPAWLTLLLTGDLQSSTGGKRTQKVLYQLFLETLELAIQARSDFSLKDPVVYCMFSPVAMDRVVSNCALQKQRADPWFLRYLSALIQTRAFPFASGFPSPQHLLPGCPAACWNQCGCNIPQDSP